MKHFSYCVFGMIAVVNAAHAVSAPAACVMVVSHDDRCGDAHIFVEFAQEAGFLTDTFIERRIDPQKTHVDLGIRETVRKGRTRTETLAPELFALENIRVLADRAGVNLANVSKAMFYEIEWELGYYFGLIDFLNSDGVVVGRAYATYNDPMVWDSTRVESSDTNTCLNEDVPQRPAFELSSPVIHCEYTDNTSGYVDLSAAYSQNGRMVVDVLMSHRSSQSSRYVQYLTGHRSREVTDYPWDNRFDRVARDHGMDPSRIASIRTYKDVMGIMTFLEANSQSLGTVLLRKDDGSKSNLCTELR